MCYLYTEGRAVINDIQQMLYTPNSPKTKFAVNLKIFKKDKKYIAACKLRS